MKIIIPTKGRERSISSHNVTAFAHADLHVLVHNNEERDRYLELNPDLASALVVTDTEPDTFGLTRQREWACRNLADPGEWFVFCDDNVLDLTAVPWLSYGEDALPVQVANAAPGWPQQGWRHLFGRSVPATDWDALYEALVGTAGILGARLVGFATNSNPYFRGKHFRTVGYVIGKMMLWKNDPYEWNHAISMEDFVHTAEHLRRYGRVLIDNFIFPKAQHYQPGGMGPYRERIEQRRQDCTALLLRYPGLFRIRERGGFEYGTDLSVRLSSEKQVERLRGSW